MRPIKAVDRTPLDPIFDGAWWSGNALLERPGSDAQLATPIATQLGGANENGERSTVTSPLTFSRSL